MFLPSSDGPNLEAILNEIGLPGFKIHNSHNFSDLVVSFALRDFPFSDSNLTTFANKIIHHVMKLSLVAEEIEKLKNENDKLAAENLKYKNFFELQKELNQSKETNGDN